MPSFIRIPGVNPDVARPAALSVDPVVAQSGALMLVDPTNPMFNQKFSGVPANGATVPNLAWESAAAAIGSGTQASLSALVDSLGMSGTKGSVTRTAKGGIHALFSQTYNKAPEDRTRYGLILPQAVREFLDAAPDHSLYLSIWGYVTRASSADPSHQVSVAGIDAGTTAHRVEIDVNRHNLPHESAATFLGSRFVGPRSPVGPFIRNVAAKGSSGSFKIGTTSPTERARLWAVGNTGILNTYAGGTAPVPLGNSGSHILYRAYLEDLTVSGRTYAQVDALDNAYYTEEVLTAGGRFYGDTFTSPATLP